MNWAYDEPADELAKYNRHVVYTQEQAIEEARTARHDDDDPYSITDQEALEEWIVVNWAYETNEPPGETITKINGADDE